MQQARSSHPSPPGENHDSSGWRAQRLTAALLIVAVLFFLFANRGAYQNFFRSDSIDYLALAKVVGWDSIWRPLLIPEVIFNNFRPVGAGYFKLMALSVGLWFPPYVASVQLLHIVNAGLVYLLLRKLNLPYLAACVGTLFFVFHTAVFLAYWEPMYVFDLLCATLCLLSLLAYMDDHWILSFIFFWLAFRAKEPAIMLPLVLAAYEALRDTVAGAAIRWKRLVPFCVLSLAVGLQALTNNATRDSAYTLRFDIASVWKCTSFYSSQVLLLPFAGFAIIAAPLLVRSRRMMFGFAAFLLPMVPMLVLPGRLYSTYLYVSLIGLATCIGELARLSPKPALVILLAFWIPWNYVNLRRLSEAELARAASMRVYVTNLMKVAEQFPTIDAFVFNDAPTENWGISGTVSWVRPKSKVELLRLTSTEADQAMPSRPVILLNWESTPPPGSLVTLAHTRETPDASHITFNRRTPLWQLTSGWDFGATGPYRWTRPSATARLMRPAGATHFEVTAYVTDTVLEHVSRSHLRVLIDGRVIGERDFDAAGMFVVRYELAPAAPGSVQVGFEVSPGFRVPDDPELYGLFLGNFGFLTH